MLLHETLRRICCCICPSYSRNIVDSQAKSFPVLRATAALDGLRGLAALSVFFFHLLFSYTDRVEYGYGQSDENRLFIQLPFIKLAFSGHAMVVVFFVVGGYVMSIKPLKLLHSRQQMSFHNALVSSVFRRSFRLYIPAIVASFITMISLWLGLWEYQRQFITEDRNYIRYDDHHIPRMESLRAQFKDWLYDTNALTNVFTYYSQGYLMPYYPDYDPHLWTIPMEYRSGMLLALALLAFARCRNMIRMWLMFLSILFVAMWERWELVCFFSGSLLCEIDLLTGAGSPPTTASTDEEPKLPTLLDPPDTLHSYWPYSTSPPTSTLTSTLISSLRTFRALSIITRLAPTLSFTFGLYLLSAPSLDIETTPGYITISEFIPTCYTDPKRLPYTIGALLVIIGLMRSPTLRTPFASPFPQYLGRISFALYVVHGPLIHVVGLAVTPTIWARVTGVETLTAWLVGLAMGSAVLIVCVLLLADLFWRTVEVWSVDVARRVEGWCFEGGE
jgi:peptidoglycan/LPS O-acetylase OafA/YrhL